MNARNLLIEKLKEIGADGLYNGGYGEDACGCGLDDLVPCDCLNLGECQPAKKREDGMFYPIEGGQKDE